MTTLPILTLLTGPSGVGKTLLANMLSDEIPACCALSLLAPIRGAILGAFFECDPSLDLTANATERVVPGIRDETVATFSSKFLSFLRGNFGPQILARIALTSILEQRNYFESFVIDDADAATRDDLRFLIDEIGGPNTLIVNISRPGIDPTTPLLSERANVFGFENSFSSPSELLEAFATPLNLTLRRHLKA